MLTWIFFFFVAFGAKALLAFAMIYLIFPSDRVCNECDGETMLMQMGPMGRVLSACSLGRVQRRWCPHCGWEGLTRSGRTSRAGAQSESERQATTRR
ncbi:MAG TPA: hypothetical protein VFR81_30470 [Longimicrobium sp.]|nr:hypothetical protein [Longimicrobium sp.]